MVIVLAVVTSHFIKQCPDIVKQLSNMSKYILWRVQRVTAESFIGWECGLR